MTEPDAYTSPRFQRYKPAPEAGIRLVCLPHAGGAAPFYLEFARTLHPDVDVLAVQYPGRQELWREPVIESLTELADRVAAELVPWCDRPVALFGHSLGALLGYEVARRLADAGRPAAALFASGRRAPSVRRPEIAHLLNDRDLVRELAALGGTDPRVLEDEEVLRLTLPVVRADYRAVDSYRYEPGPPLDCPVTVLTGRDDPQVRPQEAEAWRGHAGGEFEVVTFSGGHFFLVEHSRAVTELVAARLAALSGADR
ncbi:thioesterase II family protein [Catenulispora rubra]|uniref:thioesterase II family protein n=1 Tax=Catenulispora rubra TaxID=280293 RepID=UPI00189252F2|nr:alpha/beta fold hydrolase [Catenulispora rubra]